MKFRQVLIYFLFMTSCKENPETDLRVGKVVSEFKSFKGDSVGFSSKINIWYKPDYVIEEIGITTISTDTNRNSKVIYTPIKYLFIDLKRKVFSEYDSFKPSAKKIKVYSQSDSTLIEGGWNFYWDKNVEIQGKISTLPDTIENGKRYERIAFYQKGFDSTRFYCIGYIDCKRSNMFSYVRTFIPGKFNCPVVKLLMIEKKSEKKIMELSLIQQSSELTKTEQMVFSEWCKNLNL